MTTNELVTEISPGKTYDEIFTSLPGSSATPDSWLDRLRHNAFARFQELGFPSVKEEEWKYTNVAPLSKIQFQPNPVLSEPDVEPFACPEASRQQLVFVNGVLRFDLSDISGLASDVAVLDLSAAAEDERFGEVVRENLAFEADYVTNAFTALNTAFISSGAFINIRRNANLSAPLHLLFITDSVETNTLSSPRVLVVAEEGSSATIVESYESYSAGIYFTNAVVELVLKESSRIEHYKVQAESPEAFHVARTGASLGRDSWYGTTTVTLGAQLSRHDLRVNLDDAGAACRVDGLYIVSTGQHTDTHSVIDHRKPHCSSHQLYKGILDGKSRAVFNGKIFVRHDAQKTDAMQTNKNLLLSNEARVDTKPQLEILADDVKCAHGAAVGQLDEDELFYLETRGIHPDLARNLLTYGFAEEVIETIKIESIRKRLDEAVLNRLHARLET